jgi:hypothetical protein
MERREHRDEWRFFARLTHTHGGVADLWCWARLDFHERVVKVASGFTTIIAAMHDARSHGYDGPVELRPPDRPVNTLGDRRFLEILAA